MNPFDRLTRYLLGDPVANWERYGFYFFYTAIAFEVGLLFYVVIGGFVGWLKE